MSAPRSPLDSMWHALTLSLLASVAHALPELTEEERSLARAIAARASAAEVLLERAVNVNSGTMNFAGVRTVGEVFGVEFRELGFEVDWLDGAAFGRAGHLVARRGDAGPHLVFIGHLDTVFEPDSPFQRYERTDSATGRRTATGPGVVDMKGGIVVMLEALRGLRAVGALDRLRFTVVLTGDEERSGRPLDLARAVLVEAARSADAVLAFENGDSDPSTAVVARRGYTGWRLEVRATSAHSSQVFQPEVGFGAAYELARALDGFRTELAKEEFLTFNPGLVLAGSELEEKDDRGRAAGKPNVVAGVALATGDLRALSIEQRDRAMERMSRIARASLAGSRSTLTFEDGYPPLAPSEGNLELLALFDAASRDLGHGPVAAVDPRRAGAADVSFVAGHVDRAIDGLGPGGGRDHTVEEWIDLETLTVQARRVGVVLLRLAGSLGE